MGFRKSFRRWKNRRVNEKARIENEKSRIELDFLKSLAAYKGELQLYKILENLNYSSSQIFQEIIVLSLTDFKEDGYFVEFGAADGIKYSNTYLLEKKFGWNGILAEPALVWQNELSNNRNTNIDFDCVWHSTNEKLKFWELSDALLSGVSSSLSNSKIEKLVNTKKEYTVTTVSLIDLLDRYSAPKKIDYLSIDTEGTEFQIMQNFDFDKFEFSFITIEHSFSKDRDKIYNLLISNGYKRVLENISHSDDFYILDLEN